MNWITKLAIFFGRRKFEEVAQASPELPDDALQVAATLDSYTARIGVTTIVGSLAHAGDNLLRGTETVDMFVGHVFIILAGVGIVLCRHAVSARDVQINDVLQKARAAAGIGAVVKVLLISFLLSALSFQPASAQTNNTLFSGAIPISTNHTVSLIQQLFGDFGESHGILDLGPTYTGKFTHGTEFKPSLSLMAITPLSGTGHFGRSFSADWCVGPTYTYVPAWDENDVGIGIDVFAFHIPDKIGNAQASVRVVDAVTPKLTIVKLVLLAGVRVDEITSHPELRVTAGGALPF